MSFLNLKVLALPKKLKIKMKIIEKKLNPLLSRTEIKAEIEYSTATPSNENVKNQLSKLLSAQADLILIKQILPVFGLGKSIVRAYLYETKEMINKIERIKKESRESKIPEKLDTPKESPTKLKDGEIKEENKAEPSKKEKKPESENPSK